MTDPAFDAITRARNQVAGGNPVGGANTLEEYLATDPHNTGPRLVLAKIAIDDMQDLEYGMMQLDVILDLEPENYDAMKAKVSVMARDKRRNADTEELFKRILEGAPSADVYNEYARFARNQLTDFRRAQEYYERAIAMEPNNYAYHQNYAVLLLNDIRDYVKAKTELEALMRLKPDEPIYKKNYDKLMREKFDKAGNLKPTVKDRLFGKRRVFGTPNTVN